MDGNNLIDDTVNLQYANASDSSFLSTDEEMPKRKVCVIIDKALHHYRKLLHGPDIKSNVLHR